MTLLHELWNEEIKKHSGYPRIKIQLKKQFGFLIQWEDNENIIFSLPCMDIRLCTNITSHGINIVNEW